MNDAAFDASQTNLLSDAKMTGGGRIFRCPERDPNQKSRIVIHATTAASLDCGTTSFVSNLVSILMHSETNFRAAEGGFLWIFFVREIT